MKHTKYEYLRIVQGDYGFGDGWEDLTQAANTKNGRREMRLDLAAYRANDRNGRFRVISRRVLRS